jgi:hypothetical protein
MQTQAKSAGCGVGIGERSPGISDSTAAIDGLKFDSGALAALDTAESESPSVYMFDEVGRQFRYDETDLFHLLCLETERSRQALAQFNGAEYIRRSVYFCF